jgi:hypothetical protein
MQFNEIKRLIVALANRGLISFPIYRPPKIPLSRDAL